MSFEQAVTQEENLEQYRRLKSRAIQFNNQLTTWEAEFQALRAIVDVEKQAELDTRKTQLVAALRNALGI